MGVALGSSGGGKAGKGSALFAWNQDLGVNFRCRGDDIFRRGHAGPGLSRPGHGKHHSPGDHRCYRRGPGGGACLLAQDQIVFEAQE